MPSELENVLKTVHEALDFAHDYLLTSTGLIDADSESGSNLTDIEREQYLAALVPIVGHTAAKKLTELPVEVDKLTHRRIAEVLRRYRPGCLVVGQMANHEDWQRAAMAAAGSWVYVVDAIDGIVPFECLTFAHGVTVQAYRTHATGVRLELALVVNSSGLFAAFEPPRVVWVGKTDAEPTQCHEPLRPEARGDTVAVVASHPDMRRAAAPLLADWDMTVFTTGGAPAAIGMVLGALESLVSTESQTTYDAAYLPILAALGCAVVTSNGQRLALRDIVNLFEAINDGFDDRRTRNVPPHVVSRSPSVAEGLVNDIWGR